MEILVIFNLISIKTDCLKLGLTVASPFDKLRAHRLSHCNTPSRHHAISSRFYRHHAITPSRHHEFNYPN